MNLDKIKIFPSKELSKNESDYLLEIFNDFPLKGGANYETLMDADISNISRESIGEHITLSPRLLESHLRFSFEWDSLPSKYSVEYLFGGINVPSFSVITELSPNGNKFPVKRRYYIYSTPLEISNLDSRR